MKLQGASLSMQTNNYSSIRNTNAVKNAQQSGNDKKVNKPNNGSVSLSQNASFDKMIENIQEQIQKVQENDRYDADTKKSKIEELEKQLEEIEKARTAQLTESMLPEKTKKSGSSNPNNSSKKNTNDKGVILDLSIDAKTLLQADNNLKSLKNAHSMKVKLEGQSNVLASEIKIDKGRGVDTTKKEEELAKLKEGVEKSMANMGETIKDLNNTTHDVAEGSKLTVTTSGENEDSTEATANGLNNILEEPTASEKLDSDDKSE